MDPKLFVSDPTSDMDPTLKKVSAPTPNPDLTPDLDPVSDLATLVSALRKLCGSYTNVFVT